MAGETTVQQELRIYHGAGETITAMSVGPLGPFTASGMCASRGRSRFPFNTSIGAFQRVGVTPDGAGVVFELTDEFALVGHDLLPVAQRGIYYVGADGSGLRPLGPPNRVPAFGGGFLTGGFNFDPSGR